MLRERERLVIQIPDNTMKSVIEKGESIYRQTSNRWGLFPLHRGVLLLKGKDRYDFLQRMSTNDMGLLRSHGQARTIFANEKGRIVDWVWLVELNEATMLVSGYSNADVLRDWIEKFLFVEDVHVIDISEHSRILLLIGPEARHHLEESIPAIAVPGSGARSLLRGDGCDIVAWLDADWKLPGIIIGILGESAEIERQLGRFLSSADESPEGSQALESLRVESGIPSIGKELTDAVNPLEGGLQDSVSFTKGCYVGQEVIARIDTYHKLQRKLCGFSFDKEGASLLKTGTLRRGERNVGQTTSHVWSYGRSEVIALGYCATGSYADQIQFVCEGTVGPLAVRVHTLPFSS